MQGATGLGILVQIQVTFGCENDLVWGHNVQHGR